MPRLRVYRKENAAEPPEGGKPGGLLRQNQATPAPKNPVVPDNSQFQEANFAAARGNASGSKSKAAPAHGGSAAPSMPGSAPLAGHSPHPVGHAAKGKSPVRGAGKSTPKDGRPGAGD